MKNPVCPSCEEVRPSKGRIICTQCDQEYSKSTTRLRRRTLRELAIPKFRISDALKEVEVAKPVGYQKILPVCPSCEEAGTRKEICYKCNPVYSKLTCEELQPRDSKLERFIPFLEDLKTGTLTQTYVGKQLGISRQMVNQCLKALEGR